MSHQSTPDFLQNLRPTELKTAAARRFADFCLQDFDHQAGTEGFDPEAYADAVKLVVGRLEALRHKEQAA